MGKKRIVKNEQESAEKSAETKTATEISGKNDLRPVFFMSNQLTTTPLWY